MTTVLEPKRNKPLCVSHDSFLLMAVAIICVAPLRGHRRRPRPSLRPRRPSARKKIKAIRQLLVVTGTSKLMAQEMDQMVASLRNGLPDAPPEFWTKFRARVNTDDLIALIVPVYDKYYTLDDINGLLAFYQTPLGQKVITTLPQVTRESMTIGQAWGEAQAKAVVHELEQEQEAPKKHSTGKKPAPTS